jgi:hypothetical protein
MDGKPLKKEIFLSDQEFLEKVLPAFPRRNARVLEVKEVPSVYDKQVIQVKLDTGEPIDLLNFSFHLTHGDMIEGEPDAYKNKEILERLEKKVW